MERKRAERKKVTRKDNTMEYIKNRLKEPSTWGAAGIILIGCGVLFAGELIFVGLGCGVLGMIMKDDK